MNPDGFLEENAGHDSGRKHPQYRDADMNALEELVADLPPSNKLVYKTLEYEGPQTQKDLRENTRLSARTVRYALNQLEDHDAVVEDIYLPDARQTLYRLNIDD